MQFTKRLRERVKSGEITTSIRIWKRPRVKTGNRYTLDGGYVVVDRLSEISLEDITPKLARESGFAGVADLLKVAKHGAGESVYLVEFHYESGSAAEPGKNPADMNNPTPPPEPPVEQAFTAYPESVRTALYGLRELIFLTAARLDPVGPITETLKWGEPAYLTEKSKSGSTIRIGWKASAPTQYAMYLNCRTTLVDTFRTLFPELRFDGSRAMIFELEEPLPEDAVIKCIEIALTYHLTKKALLTKKARGAV